MKLNPSYYQKGSVQTWDYIHENNLCYFLGNAIKYITRSTDKNGLEDIQKAIVYLEKYIELQKEAYNE